LQRLKVRQRARGQVVKASAFTPEFDSLIESDQKTLKVSIQTVPAWRLL